MSTPENTNGSASEKVLAHESIASSEMVPGGLKLTTDQLPWMSDSVEVGAVRVTMKDEACPDFVVASALKTSPKLVEAARGMSEGQMGNCDNMFWSRIGNFVRDGHQNNVEVMPDTNTDRPIHVMRNNGGQRVYFTTAVTEEGETTVIRLAACDKNKQSKVMSVLSAAGDKAMHKKATK